MSLLGRALQRRGMTAWDPTALTVSSWSNFSGPASSSGVSVDASSALTLEVVFRGVQLISDKISGLPVRAMEQADDGTWTQLKQPPREIVDPFIALRFDEGISQIVTSLVMRGNAYLVPVAGPMGRPQWRILSPDMVHVRWGDNGQRAYRINGQDYTGRMEHLTTFMLPGAPKGAGIIEYCRNAIGLGIALAESAATFFKNGTMSPGFISTDHAMEPDEARAAADQFRQNHSGVQNAHIPIVLSGGAKWMPMSVTPDDAQFLQSRQFSQGQFATLLGIPPHLLGIVDRTTSWGTGIETQSRNFVDYTLQAYIDPIQDMLTDWLGGTRRADFETDALTRADTATRYQNYNVALVSGFYCVNEIRAMEGKPGIGPLGDIYYAPQLSVPAQQALKAAGTPTPMPDSTPNDPTGDPDAGTAN